VDRQAFGALQCALDHTQQRLAQTEGAHAALDSAFADSQDEVQQLTDLLSTSEHAREKLEQELEQEAHRRAVFEEGKKQQVLALHDRTASHLAGGACIPSF
jgi:chromosome segregation ATPase